MYGLDLFSGIGGITKALEGYVTPVAYCERDRYAVGVLLSRMHAGDLPTAPVWDDVVTLHGAMLPQVDIIYGGFPCQDISVAGRGEGLGGKRSGLFFEIVRLAKEIEPKFVFLENVPAIRTRGLSRVVRELADIGYDCRWCAVSAAEIGANHKRERWWLLAHAQSQQDRRLCEPGIRPDLRAICVGNPTKSGLSNRRAVEVEQPEPFPQFKRPNWWEVEPNVGRVVDGIHFRVDRLRALGNSVVPAQAREAFERLIGWNTKKVFFYLK